MPPTPLAAPPSAADWSGAARARVPLARSNHHGAQGPPTVPAGRAGSAARTRRSSGGRFATGSRRYRGLAALRPAPPSAPSASLHHRRHAGIFSRSSGNFSGRCGASRPEPQIRRAGPARFWRENAAPGAGSVSLIFIMKKCKKLVSAADFDTSGDATTATSPCASQQLNTYTIYAKSNEDLGFFFFFCTLNSPEIPK